MPTKKINNNFLNVPGCWIIWIEKKDYKSTFYHKIPANLKGKRYEDQNSTNHQIWLQTLSGKGIIFHKLIMEEMKL